MSTSSSTRSFLPLSIKAGRSIRRSNDSNFVDAQPGKGKIEVSVTEDGLLSFSWKSREGSSSTEDDEYILFPSDCTFTKCETDPSGRTHVLKFSSSDVRLFYWFQDASSEHDETHAYNINQLIQDPEFVPLPITAARSEPSAKPRQSSAADAIANMSADSTSTSFSTSSAAVQSVLATPAPSNPASSSSGVAVPATPHPQRFADFGNLPAETPFGAGVTPAPVRGVAGSLGGNQTETGRTIGHEQVAAFAQAIQLGLSGDDVVALGQQSGDAKLTTILTIEKMTPVFQNKPELINVILRDLPSTLPISSPPTTQEIEAILASSQWVEAVSGLDAVLRTGGSSNLISGLGLPERAGQGVTEFVDEVLQKGKKDAESSGSGDKMQTD